MDDQYVEALLAAFWDIPGWPKNEAVDRRKVRQWVKQWPADQVDMLRLISEYDTWTSDNPIGSEKNKSPRSRFEKWVKRAIEWGSAAPIRKATALTASPLSVEEQIRMKNERRQEQLRNMGAVN